MDPERFELCEASCKDQTFSIIFNKKATLRLLIVDPERFELSTFSMPLRRAPNCAMGPFLHIFLFSMALPIPPGGDFVRYGPLLMFLFLNGPGGIRTLDLFSAIEARSQLRYRPVLHPDFKSQYSNGLNRECQAFLDSPKSALLSRNKKSQSCSGWLSANLDRIKRRYW